MTETLTHEGLVALLRAYREDVERDPGGLARNVHDGCCADNADTIWRQSGRQAQVTRLDSFSKAPWTDWDHARIAANPAVQPPPGLSWDDLAKGGWIDGAHTWVVLEGRHYDIEAVEGVDNPFDLNDIRRGMVRWLRRRDPALLSSLSADPWWRESLEILSRPLGEPSAPGMR